jgi:outer membrane protein
MLLPAQQQILTLEQCVELALQNNRKVKQQSLMTETREIAYEQARKDLLPNLSASAGQNFSYGRVVGSDNVSRIEGKISTQTSFNLSSGVTLFDGLRLKKNIDARKADMHASEADLDKIKSDITMSVTSAFLQTLMNRELLKTADEQIALTRADIAQRKLRVENGKLAEGELYELYAQEAKEAMNSIRHENELKLSLLDLAQILELEDFQQFDIIAPLDLFETELSLLSPKTVYERALINRPEIKGAEYRLESSEKSVDIARADYLPTLTLGGDIGTGYYSSNTLKNFGTQMSENLAAGIGLSLRIPIFNKFQTRNRVKSALLEVENNRIQIEDTKLELRKKIEQAYQNALAAKTRWDAAEKSKTAAEESYRFTEQKYETERATAFELFQAKNNLTQALSELTQSKYEYVFRLKIMELLM